MGLQRLEVAGELTLLFVCSVDKLFPRLPNEALHYLIQFYHFTH